ncbi:hypothetical protein J6G99_06210 [bacterium]|nr:hypothetical protein [bacterium]
MQVSKVDIYGLKNYTYKTDDKFAGSVPTSNLKNIKDLRCMPYYRPTFTSFQSAGKLKTLFEYGLPCMYTGVPMIDPKQVMRLIKNNVLNGPAVNAIEAISKYKDSLYKMEADVFDIIVQRAKIHPKSSLKSLLNEVVPYHKILLKKEQSVIFRKLYEYSNELPAQYKSKFNLLMEETKVKLSDEPLKSPFSAHEFRYKLLKIRDDVARTKNLKQKKAIVKLINESKRLPIGKKTDPSIIKMQKDIILSFEKMVEKSALKDNVEIKQLIDNSKSRLMNEKIVIPFSRKSFIHDLGKIIETLPDEKLKQKFLIEASKLPTSNDNISAYIVKSARESSEKIGYRLLWPSMASVEHLFPRSKGGMNAMENYGGATTKANTERSSIDFLEQLEKHPEIKEYCQKYVDRLIELYKKGVFARNNISTKYIKDFKNTIYKLSAGKIDLDISEYKPFQMSIPFTLSN